MQDFLNLFVIMFQYKKDLDLTIAARPTLLFGQLFVVHALGDLESVFVLELNTNLMHVQITIPTFLINKGMAREIIEQIGTIKTVETPMGNFYEAKVMVPMNSPMTKKVVYNTSRKTYYMYAFYPKLPFHACTKCFVLNHDENKCKEIQMRIYVKELPAPSPKASHVTVTKVASVLEKGESSGSIKIAESEAHR